MPLVVLLVVVAVLWELLPWIALFVAAAVAAMVVGKWLAHLDDQEQARWLAQAQVCARADRQHAAVLAGDESGVYGDYPPACPSLSGK